jgi:glucose/arabinose dehydrogenase
MQEESMNASHNFSSSGMAWVIRRTRPHFSSSGVAGMIRRTLPLVCLLAILASPQVVRAEAQVVRAGAQVVRTGAQAVSPDSRQTTPLSASLPTQPGQEVRIVLHTESAAPVCLAMDAHGALYMADEKAGTVRCVTRDGESGVLVSGLRAPCAIAVSHRRELVVGTRLGEIWKVMPDGSAILAGRMNEPVVSVTVDRDGAVLAATEKGIVLRIAAQ